MEITLRDYQEQILDSLFHWWDNNTGNPCVVAPTGSGKSILLAEFCRRACTMYPKTHIVVCSHQKELIEQDFDKLKELWFWSDAGIYSASIGLKELGNQITFAGIQSIYRHYEELGKVDIILVDEAHTIQAKDTGMYRTFINGLTVINPALKVVGFTATPYRLDCGMITDKPAIFDEPLINIISIKELQDKGYLSQLTSKATGERFNLKNVKITAGDYNKKELTAAVDIPGTNTAVVDEVIKRAEGRHSWVFFCTEVEHAEHIKDLLVERGVNTAIVTGKTPKAEREQILDDFKAGNITAITNVGVLTTGFDAPNIDLIVMLRPTLSPGLYTQMIGRGLRIAENKQNCLVLDFAENVYRHGPVTDVQPPRKKDKKKKGIAPCKICPECQEIIPIQTKTCPVCGYKYPEKPIQEKKYQLSDFDITGRTPRTIQIKYWTWRKTVSKNGNDMIAIRYYPEDFLDETISEFLLLWHENERVRGKAISRLNWLCDKAKVECPEFIQTTDLIKKIDVFGMCPTLITYHKENGYPKIDATYWEEDLRDVQHA